MPAENSEKNAARSTTLYIRNGTGMEDYFYIFASATSYIQVVMANWVGFVDMLRLSRQNFGGLQNKK